MITYKQLLERLQQLTTEQLDMPVTVYVQEIGTVYGVTDTFLSCEMKNIPEFTQNDIDDVLTCVSENHPILSV